MIEKDSPDRLLSRRETLGLIGAVGVTALVGCGTDSGSAAATNTPTQDPTGTATTKPPATPTATTAATATTTSTNSPTNPPTQAPTETATSPATSTATGTPTATVTPGTLSCVVKPALTEGPFFVDEGLNRADLTSGTTEPFVTNGLPLRINFGVYQVTGNSCTPLSDAQVDVWHASAEGVYSDEASGGIQNKNTVGETYLRGYQLTDQNGAAGFLTIYPGWYMGRTIHIHFKIRTFSVSGQKTFEFTSQLFIDDAINDVVLANAPYNTRGTRTVRNANDNIYGSGGSQLTLALQPASSGAGYMATFTIGLQMS
ncbi:MAG: intradiol ring-cleavage dioxygenase [Deltaproteobacteria bacterium]|nr:intradiol ring-cleavage dioxygenase [Deltaproteobacteria bacterium]MBI3390516.1 intradiol ring-cleavage dioxygenase [Deltaproteobacteria bacterium]